MARFNYKFDFGQGYRRREVLISSGRNRHATPFCISKYLRNRPRVGGTTSQGARLVGRHVKIASSGAKRKPNPTGGAEGSEISGLPKAGERTKTQRFKKKGVLEGLHEEIGGLYRLLRCKFPLSGVKRTWSRYCAGKLRVRPYDRDYDALVAAASNICSNTAFAAVIHDASGSRG